MKSQQEVEYMLWFGLLILHLLLGPKKGEDSVGVFQ